MPMVITREELDALIRDDAELDHVLEMLERSLVERHGGSAGHVVFADLPLAEGNAFKLMACSAEGGPATLRVFPAQSNTGSREDAAFLLLLDGQTGGLRALLAGDDLNPLRTSVPAGLGARHLSPPRARVLGILGSGAQARGHARVISRVMPQLSEILVWSPTPDNRARFAEEQSALLGVRVRACDSAEEVVASADVVTAAGNLPGGTPAYEAEWVRPGALAISMTASAPEELRSRSRFVVPTLRRPERVAFGFAGKSRPRPASDPEGLVELAEIIARREPARLDPTQPVIWELGNVYLWDQPIATWALEWAERRCVGSPLNVSLPSAQAPTAD